MRLAARAPATEMPLSYGQAFWCGWPNSFDPHFVVSEALRVAGNLDVSALQEALDLVVRRHDALRSVVVRHDAGLDGAQLLYDPPRVSLDVLQKPDGADPNKVSANLLRRHDLTHVDPHRAPLLTARLCRLGSLDHLLVLAAHHTACDGWSWDVVKRDLGESYRAIVRGEAPDLPEVVPFGEFVQWQRDHLSGPSGERLASFWREELDGVEIFALPRTLSEAPEDTPGHTTEDFELSGAVVTTLRDFALAERASMFSVLLAAVNVVAHEVFGATDPTIMTMSAGRPARRFFNTVGPFMDFVPVRTVMSRAMTFRGLARECRAACLRSVAHDVPQLFLEGVLPELMAPVTSGRMVDFVFGYERPAIEQPSLPIAAGAVSVRRPDGDDTGAPEGVVWTVGVLDDGIMVGRVQFDRGEFPRAVVARWVERYLDVLSRGLAEPDSLWPEL